MQEQVAEPVPDLRVVHSEPLPHVALVGLPPVYAKGLQAVLQHSTASCSVVSDLGRLPAQLAEQDGVVLVVPAAAGAAALIALPAGTPVAGPAGHGVVVLLDEATPEAMAEACAAALRDGMTGVITTGDALDDVLIVLRGAARGQTVLARETVQALCRPAVQPGPSLTAAERGWLRRLAAGGTVAGLARSCGYSEREMYRRLSTLYLELGARTRTEALLVAERSGLLDEPA